MAGGGNDRHVRARKGLQFESEVGNGSTDSWTGERVEEELVRSGDVIGEEEEAGIERVRRVPRRRNEEGRFQRRSDDSSSSVVAPKKKSGKDVSWLIDRRVPGGPDFPHVIPSFGGHIANTLWSTPNEVGRPVLMGYHRFDSMAENYNMPLISAFVERWQPDTNSFHMPFGEMSILLHDVAQILGVRVDGNCCKVESNDGTLADPLMYVCGFFGISSEQLRLPLNSKKKVPIYKSGGILVDAVCETARANCDVVFARGFLVSGVGVDTFCRQIGPGPPSAIDPTQPRSCSWRSVGPFAQNAEKLLEYRRLLDRLTCASIRWDPYGPRQEEYHPRTLYAGCIRFMDIAEPYQPDRCLRQFGYVQIIPNPIMRLTAHRPASGIGYEVRVGVAETDHLWDCWQDHVVQLSRKSRPVSFPGETGPDYEAWYNGNSHPFIIDPGHHDAPAPHDDFDIPA
ncbi:serine/threonine-protein phosphatase 7 long form homolog [Silene latifolia]|uniref:serine/threonine-protein phosphatase 7 long form homolog n=1 Tax=Silene latifolia TaxID=37657 RepID=UPI003D77700B